MRIQPVLLKLRRSGKLFFFVGKHFGPDPCTLEIKIDTALEFETLDPIIPPAIEGRLTNQQILLGQRLDPLEVIKIYTADDWEKFIREWVEGLRSQYKEVRRASGSGDKGRDVIGYTETVNADAPWDNY